MKRIVIKGKCWVNYEKQMVMPDEEAEEFMSEFKANPDTAYCLIDEDNLEDIECVDDGEVICTGDNTELSSNT